MRTHLATLVEDFRRLNGETALVTRRGVRRYTTSYGELAGLAARFAAELNRRGIAPGERVVLWGANSPEWIAAFFGCLLRGVLAVPLDAAGSPAFARRVLLETAPRLVVADENLLGAATPEEPGAAVNGAPALVLGDLRHTLPPHGNFAVASAVTEDAPFQILFTSGTTAEPKGIVHTHRNVLASLRPIEAEIAKYRRPLRIVHPLRLLHTLPLSHVFGQFMGLWVPVLLRAELHLAESHAPTRLTETMHDERISVLIAVPRVLELLRAHLLRAVPGLAAELGRPPVRGVLRRWWRFRSVHCALGWKFWAFVSGGAALPPELERFWNLIGYALIQGYGMTETAALITLNHPFRIAEGSLGRALPGREVRLSEAGEILVRGDMVATATWQAGRLQPRTGEWLATGDLGEQTASGELRFRGRSGDAIVTAGGLNVYPSDLETALLAQPGVRACAVVACSLDSGPEPVSVVIFQGDDAALAASVTAANTTLAPYQQMRRVLRWPDPVFPVTNSGKLLRRTIRAWACAATLRDHVNAPREGGRDMLLSMIAEVSGGLPVRADDASRLSEDLRLDSLGRVQLLSLMEQQFDVELSEEAVASLATLGDLRAAVDRALAVEDARPPASAPRGTLPLSETGTHAEPGQEALGTGLRVGSSGASSPVSRRTSPDTVSSPQQRRRREQHRYPRWPWLWPVRLVRLLFQDLLARPLVALLLAPQVQPSPRPLPNGPLLIIANHVTMLDGPLVLYALPGELRRRVAIAMSGEMLLNLRHPPAQGSTLRNVLAPIAALLLRALYNVFPLPRLAGVRRSFQHAGAALDRGDSVLLFPEGTRSRSGAMGPFRQGIGLLAAQAEAPVLPVALLGLDSLRARWFRSGRLAVRVGAAIDFVPGRTPAEWTELLEQTMHDLLTR